MHGVSRTSAVRQQAESKTRNASLDAQHPAILADQLGLPDRSAEDPTVFDPRSGGGAVESPVETGAEGSESLDGCNAAPLVSEESDEAVRQRISPEKTVTVCLVILTVLAVYSALYAARAVLLPITLSALIALTLRPIVRYMRKWKFPDAFSAGLLLLLILSMVIAGAVLLLAPAEQWIAGTPEMMQDVRTKLKPITDHFEDWSRTSERVGEMTGTGAASESEPVVVEVRESGLAENLAVASLTGSLLGTGLVIFALSFFLLAAGDRMLNNVLKMFQRFSHKKCAVSLVYDVEKGIASYLLTVTIINVSVGVLTWLITWAGGLPNPMLWGILAWALNYIPVFGPTTTFVILGLVSIVSLDTLTAALIPPVLFVIVSLIEGNLVSPALLGRSMSLSPIMVLLALILWGWIWGIGGALIAVPLLAILKTTLEKFPATRDAAYVLAD